MQILKKFGGNTEMSNKLQVPEADRCRFTSAHGKRCRNPLRGGAGGLCIIHQQQFENLNNADARAISDQLLGAEPELRTHGNLNQVMSQLFILVAQKRISRQDGSLLAYIGSLLLQTITPSGKQQEPPIRIVWDSLPLHPAGNDSSLPDDAHPGSTIPRP